MGNVTSVKTAFHMNHRPYGEFNTKFVLAEAEYFEAVYDINGNLVNNPVDMGTYMIISLLGQHCFAFEQHLLREQQHHIFFVGIRTIVSLIRAKASLPIELSTRENLIYL